jgi:hypothetical protein
MSRAARILVAGARTGKLACSTRASTCPTPDLSSRTRAFSSRTLQQSSSTRSKAAHTSGEDLPDSRILVLDSSAELPDTIDLEARSCRARRKLSVLLPDS